MLAADAQQTKNFCVEDFRTAISNSIKTFLKFNFRLFSEWKNHHLQDRLGLPVYDHGPDIAIEASIEWLCLAQDCSISHDGGVAFRYSLLDGWGASFPETTGYIVPTIIKYAILKKNEKMLRRAELMMDWLTTVQTKEGGFRGGQIGSKYRAPVFLGPG